MKTLELFFWRVPGRDGRLRKTRFRMIVAQARETYGNDAECLVETREVRDIRDEPLAAAKFNPFRECD